MGKIYLKKNEYLSDYKVQVIKYLEKEKRICINSNPGTGKTRLIVELCENLIKSGGSGRIVFCAPFIIIQEQFASELVASGIKPDLNLNHLSNRKKLLSKDKIVTSTLQSFKLISDSLNPEDIVVIDEAHCLANSYGLKPLEKEFYDSEILSLLNTKAHLLLLSGTPNTYINKLLDVSTIYVNKENEPKSTVSIATSNHSPIKIAEAFSSNAMSKSGRGKLNIIYIKDKRQCELIKDSLKEKGFKAEIVNTNYKKQDVYMGLKSKMSVANDVDFLICTNLISTGTNVLNENIGMALMINETHPTEIKQFSKRFRKQLDIDIQIVLNNQLKPRVPSKKDADVNMKESVKKLEDYQEYYNNIISMEIPEDFKDGYGNHNLGSSKNFQEIMVARITERIAYIQDLEADICINPIMLSNGLKKYSDIHVIGVIDRPSIQGIHSSKNHKANFERELEEIRCRFMLNPQEYQNCIVQNENEDYYLRRSLEDLDGFDNSMKIDENLKESINKDINHPHFDSEILEPLISLYPFIDNILFSLDIIGNCSNREINKLKISIYVSTFRDKFLACSIKGKKLVFKVIDSTIMTSQQILFTKILIRISELCLGKSSVAIETIVNEINTQFGASLRKHKELHYPMDELFKGGKINSERMSSLVKGLIYCKPKLNKITYPIIGEKSSIVFEQQLPQKQSFAKKEYENLLSDSLKSKLQRFDDKGEASDMIFGIPDHYQILPNKELLIYDTLKNRI